MQHPLSQLSPGQSGIVLSIGDAGALRQRLISMGVTPGAYIQLIKFAPLGDPMEIRVRNSSLSIRRQDAEQILVEMEDKNV